MKEALIDIIKNLKAISRTGKSDPNISEIDVDIRRLYGYPPFLRLVSDGLFGLIKSVDEKSGKKTTCVAAAGYGGVPLATAMSLQYHLNQSMIRTHPNEGARSEWFEGHTPTEKDRVVIVEDSFSKGRSLAHIVDVVKDTGAEIIGYFVVLNRRKGAAEIDVPVHYLIHSDELEPFA